MAEESKISKAQQKAVNKYVKNNYDRINVTFPKGKKAQIKSYAEIHGESVNAFIVRAVNETMEREGGNIPPAPEPQAAKSASTSPERKPEPEEKLLSSFGSTGNRKARIYAPLTPENIAKVDLKRLLPGVDIKYQMQVMDAFGSDGLQKLAEIAQLQESDTTGHSEDAL